MYVASLDKTSPHSSSRQVLQNNIPSILYGNFGYVTFLVKVVTHGVRYEHVHKIMLISLYKTLDPTL